jgi:hypothetical protein
MTYLIHLREFFTSTPTGVWLAVVALLGTFVGSAFAQWGVSRQLRHDAEQRRLDREMTIRREVYLGAVMGIAKLQEYLVSLAKTDRTEQERALISEGAFGLINKVYLVGNSQTIRAVLSIYEAFSKAAIHLAEKQIEVMVLVARAQSAASRHEEVVRRTQQLGTAITSAGRSARGDLLEPLLRDLKHSETESQALLDASAEATRNVNLAKLGLLAEMSDQIKAFEEPSESALILVRRELGFQTDEEEFRRMLTASGDMTRKLQSQWVEKVKEIVRQAEKEF